MLLNKDIFFVPLCVMLSFLMNDLHEGIIDMRQIRSTALSSVAVCLVRDL